MERIQYVDLGSGLPPVVGPESAGLLHNDANVLIAATPCIMVP